MTGSYSNNQPDYSWISPYSVKEATNYWSPVRDLEIVKNATTDASVTLQLRDAKTVFYGFNTTHVYKDATVALKYDNETLATKKINIDPATPFTATYKGKVSFDEYQLYAELRDADGNLLISYKPYQHQKPALPERQQGPGDPKTIESVEDLYLAGRFVEQFSRTGTSADAYYLEGLRKSPNDYRINLAMGIRRIGQWRYDEAEKFLQTAYDKLQVQFIQPKEGELFYYLALAQKGLGRYEEAYDNFYRATWYYEWFSPAYYQLAQMESTKGNYAKALEQIQEAYSSNNYDGSINVLYSALLRKQGKKAEALALIDKLLVKDPINFSAIYEKECLQASGSMAQWQKNMQDVDNNYLDIAVNYVNAGLYGEAVRLLSSLAAPKNVMVRYYLAWLYGKTDEPVKAREQLVAAAAMPYDYCFPFRETSQQVLKYAIENDKQNAMPCYLLGNLLYDRRPAEAVEAWKTASRIQPDFPMVWRNLAFAAFYQQGDVNEAIDCMKKAIAADATKPGWYAEIENYYDLSKQDFREVLTLFENNLETVKQDVAAPQKLVRLYNLNGAYDKAIDLLASHHFRTWEGAREIHSFYVDSHVLKALQLMNNKQYKEAIEHLNAALLYPENLEVGKALDDGRAAMMYYLIGQSYDQLGQKKNAKKAYEQSIAAKNNSTADLPYYQAKACEALGQTEKVKDMFEGLIKRGESIQKNGAGRTGIGVEDVSWADKSVAQGYYLQGLGYLGLGNEAKASDLFREALKHHSNNLWATYYASQK
jgi:tetratricopeptide (TPR) repeat protein